jgi:hypothetical protein
MGFYDKITDISAHYKAGDILHSTGCYASFYQVAKITNKSIVIHGIGTLVHERGHSTDLILPDTSLKYNDSIRVMISNIREGWIKAGFLPLDKWDGNPIKYYQD